MKALLLVAHGSRKASSNDAVEQLTAKLRDKLLASEFSEIEHAFLELATPSIPEGIARLVKKGVSQLVVMPYFLAPGTHVVDDVPAFIQAARQEYPEVVFTIVPHLGGVEGMADLILESADVH